MRTAKRIPLSVPVIGARDREYVLRALDTGWVSTAGPDVREFEAAIANIVGTRFAVSTASGTAAIHLGLLAAGVGSADLVIVPTLTFIGTVNPITFCGATPLFADVTAADGNVDAAAIREYLGTGTDRRGAETFDSASGRRIAAMLPVHLFGLAPDMTMLCALARDHGIRVVEDAAEAFGSRVDGRGAGAMGDVGCLSFNGNKIVTTGGGGMVVTDDEERARRARYLSTQARDDSEEFVHHGIGFNYRMTNLQAALGLAQITNLDERLARKRHYAELYRTHLAGLPLRFLESRPGSASNYWLTAIVLEDPAARPRLIRRLRDDGIEARSFFQPIHRQRPYRDAPCTSDMRVAEDLYARGVNLPSSVDLEEVDIERISAVVRQALTSRG